MNALEIRFRNDEVYLLKKHLITLSDYERTIKTFDYSCLYSNYKSIKDEDGVEKIHLPPMNYVFYSYVFYNHAVLSPDQFVKEYFSAYENDFHKDCGVLFFKSTPLSNDALIGRLLRTYPSLIRDFHFFLMLVEDGTFEQVIYSCHEDIKGKDIIIKHHDKEYEISLYVDTNRANIFKKIKNAFRHSYGTNEIRVPLDLKEAMICGDFYVYQKKDIDTVKQRII